jgi:hypothetical protein
LSNEGFHFKSLSYTFTDCFSLCFVWNYDSVLHSNQFLAVLDYQFHHSLVLVKTAEEVKYYHILGSLFPQGKVFDYFI